jgi:secreted trypsin-like serine protease
VLRRKLSVVWAAAIMLLTVLVCSGIALAITFGTDDRNKHPNVGALVDEGGVYCSGTLVAGKNNGPPVFLTAAHCDTDGNTVRVTFASNYTEGSSTTRRGTFHADPSFSTGGQRDKDPHDMAVVVFNNPPQGLPLAKLPRQGSLSNLPKGKKFTAVGYGATSGTSSDYGVRRYSVSSLSSTQTYYLTLSQNSNQGNGGTCTGDSGGPNFLGAGTTETNINAALSVTGDAMCKSTNTVLRLDTQTARGFLGNYVALP